jgi:hypothetical protein
MFRADIFNPLRFIPRSEPTCGLLKGQRRFFTVDDDRRLREFKNDPAGLSWINIAKLMPGFSPRQLRERWSNYLSPGLKTTSWTEEEDVELVQLHAELGPRWGIIGARMGNRSAPDTKNRFQALLHRSEKTFQGQRLGERSFPVPDWDAE